MGRLSERSYRHLRLLVELRWQIFRNLLRTRRRKTELAAQVFMAVLGMVISLGLGLALGGTTYYFFAKGKAGVALLSWLLEFIFLAWLFGPILIEGSSPALDFREIARYPVSFHLYFLLYTAYGLLDPWALLCLLWLACIWAGTALAQPDWAISAAFWMALLASIALLSARALFSVLEPALASRRGREWLAAMLALLIIFANVFVYGMLPRWGKTIAPALKTSLANVQSALPAGFVVAGLQNGSTTGGAIAFFGLAGYGLLAALILRRQLWKNYQGETVSESARFRGVVQMQAGWKLPGLDEITSAIVEKELRYVRHDAKTLWACLTAPLMAIIVVLGSAAMRSLGTPMKLSDELWYVILAGYIMMGLNQQIYNCFALEGKGFQYWLMSPVEPRDVLRGKNVALGFLVTTSFAAVTLLLVSGGKISFEFVAAVILGFVCAAFFLFGVGNLLSVRYPTPVALDRLSGSKPSPVAILVALSAQVVILGSVGMVIYVARRTGHNWVPFTALPPMIVLAWRFYLYSLQAASRYIRFHPEGIAKALV